MSIAGLTSVALLEGRWSLTREIVHESGETNRFQGIAVFSRSGPRMIEDQTGELWVGPDQPVLRATRRYVWLERDGRIEVLFGDMRPFHTVPLNTARPSTTHLCTPDRYHVSYDFSEFPVWTATWEVEGPRKAYRMNGRYERTTALL